MSTLPHVSGSKVVQALNKIGYEKDRQKEVSIVMRQVSHPHRRIVVPDRKGGGTKKRCVQSFTTQV